MILFDSPMFSVSQGFFTGWKVKNKLTGAIAIPNWLLKERIGLVWMQVRRTKKSASINSHHSEYRMFQSFGLAVLEPSNEVGELWKTVSADELADMIIESANQELREMADMQSMFRQP